MLRIDCPLCGLRDETEFLYGGDATRKWPDMAVTEVKPWLDYVFIRDNPRGPHVEHWQHTGGCRAWLVVERDTVTNAFGRVCLARESAR